MHLIGYESIKRGTLILVLLILGLSTLPGAAQSVWTQSHTAEGIGVEWMKFARDNDFRDSDHPSALSSSMFLFGRLKLDPRFYLVGELPLSHWQYIDDDGLDAQDPHTTVGNLYIGVEWYISSDVTSDSLSYLELGVRFPSMPQPDFPDQRGYFSGRMTTVERVDAFQDDFLPIHLYYNVRLGLNDHVDFRLRTGLAYWSYQKEAFGSEDENLDRGYFHYGGIFYFHSPYFNASFGLLGQYWALNQREDYDHVPASYEIASHLQYNGMNFQPGFFIKIPINTLYDVQAVYGLTAQIPIHRN